MVSDSDARVGRELAHLRELNQRMEELEGAEDYGEEYERLGRERTAEIERVSWPDGLWHPTSLAAELGVSIGVLTSWEAWE